MSTTKEDATLDRAPAGRGAKSDQGPSGGVTPHLTIGCGRAAEAIDFYSRALGATERLRLPAGDADPRLMHGHLTINDSSVMLADDFSEHRGGGEAPLPAGVTMHLEVDDTDRWYGRAIDAGATVVMAPADMFWGARYAQILDPFGHRWAFGSPIKPA